MKTLKRKTLAALLALSLLASLLPLGAQPAQAAENVPGTLVVGNVTVNTSQDGYWTTDGTTGNLTESSADKSWNVHYDMSTNILYLNAATITASNNNNNNPSMVGIYASASENQPVSLNIILQGENKVSGDIGIYVYSSSNGDASLSIEGGGSLKASGSVNSGIRVQSNSSKATLTIQNAEVEATVSASGSSGVTVHADKSSEASLSVDGGSLTASGRKGILFPVGTPQLTVDNNTIVRASNGIGAGTNEDSVTPDGTGIVFDDDKGTVYGSVTLQEDLTIGEDESLTLAKNARLSAGGYNVIVDGGTLDEDLVEDLGDSVKYPPTITTTILTDGRVGEPYSASLGADGTAPITWSVTNGSLPTGLSLNGNTISGTPTTAGTSTFTVTATNTVGSDNSVATDSKQFTLTIEAAIDVSVESVSLDKTTLELTEGSTETLTATITPNNATNQNVTWESSNPSVATVDESGKVTAVAPGEATITVTTEDGSKTATCTVIVHTATTITTQPQSVSVTEGQSATFSVTATGDNLRYQWQINSGNGWSAITGATDASYTIDRTTTAMSGNQYHCIVTGDGGEVASDAAMLTVNDRPTIPPVTPPSVSEETIDAILDAEPGETVSVALEDGDTTLDAEVFETLAGQDITLEIALEGGVTWTVNGQDIPADANLDDLDLGVTLNSDGIPVDVFNTITGERDTVQMTLAHDGAFGFTMTLTAPLGAENAGYWANLYHYDEEAERLTFETAAEIDADGSVSLSLSHASQYAIVIDDHSHATIDLPFSDVSDSDWFYDPVVWIYNEGLMTGTSATTFEPNTSTTRAMIVAMLARLENVTDADSAGFTDVADGDWYATAVNWAAASGITSGTGDGNFSPNTAITREQLAAILMNYAQYKGQDVSARATLDTYNDATAISSWANDVMSWAVAEGLLTGVTNDQLQPQGNATRAQVAAILERFLDN